MSSKRTQANKGKQQERARKQRQWEQEDKTIKAFRRRAPYIKMILRGRGCALPFHDFLDSYSDEFQRIAAAAKSEHPSLIGIHEVDEHTYAESDKNWSEFGCGDLQQIIFDMDRNLPDYGTGSPTANLCGSMYAFLDSEQNVRSVILIRQAVKGTLRHRELKYVLKLASLLHEIGHVQDLEQGLNFDVTARRFQGHRSGSLCKPICS